MKKEKPSASAEKTSALRAAEWMKAERERVCDDPFAKDFIGTKYKIIVGTRS